MSPPANRVASGKDVKACFSRLKNSIEKRKREGSPLKLRKSPMMTIGPKNNENLPKSFLPKEFSNPTLVGPTEKCDSDAGKMAHL